jgi:hypothetical protein
VTEVIAAAAETAFSGGHGFLILSVSCLRCGRNVFARAVEEWTRLICNGGLRRYREYGRRSRLGVFHAREVGLRRLVGGKLHGFLIRSVLGLRRQRDLAALIGDDLVGAEDNVEIRL